MEAEGVVNSSKETQPTEIRLSKDRRLVTVSYSNADQFEFRAEFLRVVSPSAEVQGHSPEQRKTVGGKADVSIQRIEPVGNYAIRICFDDQHDTGIFSWGYLLRLGREQDQMWRDYLGELEEKGLSRTMSGSG